MRATIKASPPTPSMSGGRNAVWRVTLMLTWKSRLAARRKRAISKPSMPKAFTTRKPEIVSCRISEMSRQRRSDVSLEARRCRPSHTSGYSAAGITKSEKTASFQSFRNRMTASTMPHMIR